MQNVPDDEEVIQNRLGIAEPEKVGNNYQESIQYPSLNIDGLQSAWVGEQTRTIVPATAAAALDIRLVPENDPQRLINLVKEHIASLGYHFVNNEPTKSERMKYDRLISFDYQYLYPAFRTDFNTPIDFWLTRVMKNIFTEPIIKIRQAGGSVPISLFINELNVPAVLLTMVNMDDNQHSPNENIRLGNYFEGVQTCLSLLTTKIDK
jgi:acetylornithine deacetylase/succinyl-diaminopimelate desuccinylase-like protein